MIVVTKHEEKDSMRRLSLLIQKMQIPIAKWINLIVDKYAIESLPLLRCCNLNEPNVRMGN